MAGTWTFIRLIWRRDRIKPPLWIILITSSLIAMVPMLDSVYGDEAGLLALNQSFGLNPAGLFLTGPMDGATLGALMTIETVLWWGMVVAFMNTLMVVRHTRQNEEMGAQELLLSGQASRGAGLAAVLIVAVAVNLIIGLVVAVGLDLISQEWSSNSAWVYGLTLASFGLSWAVIAAIVAQFAASTRSANGLLAALIGIAFVVRGIGDFMGQLDGQGVLQPAWISQLSPLGWLQAARALTHPDWWPSLAFLVFSALTVPLAFWLLARRDVGEGLLPTRAGKLRASKFLATPLGLTWKLQKNVFIGWLAATVAMVATIAALAPEMSSIFESSDSMRLMIESLGGSGEILPVFLSAMLAIIVLMVAAYVVQALGRLRGEESSGHLESILAVAVSRPGWLMSHLVMILALAAVMLAVTGLSLAALVNLVIEDTNLDMLSYGLASLSYWPAVALFAAGYVALFGLGIRQTGAIIWSYFGLALFLQWLAPLLQLNDFIMHLSPFSYLAAAPAEEIKLLPLLVMTILAAGLIIIGLISWRRRDLLEK